jgi:hypothetical protein
MHIPMEAVLSTLTFFPFQASPWKRCWVTAAEEHNRHPVTAMLYSSSYQGLAGGDGHAGWLVSASNRLLNLWECNAGGGVAGEPSLQVSVLSG